MFTSIITEHYKRKMRLFVQRYATSAFSFITCTGWVTLYIKLNTCSVHFYVCVFRFKGVVIGNLYGPGTGPIWLYSVHCDGDEPSIAHCSRGGWGIRRRSFWGTHTCDHTNDVSVSCGSSPVQPGWFSRYHISRYRRALQ